MTVRRMREVAGIVARVAATEATLARDGLRSREGPGGEQRRARALRHMLEELGPFYVKVGQMLSTRPDMVPDYVIDELRNLHQNVAVAPFADFEPVLEDELGGSWRDLFRDIDPTPIGAASLAQVYRVTLVTGEDAIVKIQRPGIAPVMLDDMAMLGRLTRGLSRRARDFSEVIDVESTLESIFSAMRPELDFRVEAANMEAARPLIARYETLAVPEVVFVTERVLVQSVANGTSIRDADRNAFTVDERMAMARELLTFMFRGFFVDRIFHADPHAGNVFVAPGGKAYLIDWGMVGRLDRRLSLAVMNVILNIAANDGHGAARAWIDMGRATPRADMPGFSNDLALIVPAAVGASLDQLDFGVSLTRILKAAARRGIQTSPLIGLLGKAFANVEGSIRYLAPELQLIEVFQDAFEDIMFDLVLEAISRQQIGKGLIELLTAAAVAPEQARSVLRDASNREFGLKLTHANDRRTEAAADARAKALRRAVLAAGGAAAWAIERRSRG